ncbi:MAG: ATP-binding cassette domain-containing protein [Chloroflexota bacterium]
MHAAEAQQVWKAFNSRTVVQDVSFTVDSGEILGLVGPNGAGKTTTIRMLLDIIKPDQGQVLLFGEHFCAQHRKLLGYLPEERGLYRGLRVKETLEYLGALRGMDRAMARERAEAVLDRVGMSPHRSAKVGELSRGMAQLVQFAATIMHRPRLIVMDEPFSGLDPVNTRTLEEILLEMRQQGAAIILSTHQMNQVEKLCDRVLMINQGRMMLYGSLGEIRTAHSQGSILLECKGHPGDLPGVEKVAHHGTFYELVLAHGASPQAVLEALVQRSIAVQRFEVSALPLEEIFIRVVRAAQ